MPMPPSRASAIARRASVTVSIAAETIGIASSIVRVSRVRVETSFGRTRDSAGTSRTSSNVRPSLANFRSRATSRCSSSWRSSTLKGCQGTTLPWTSANPNMLLTPAGYRAGMRVLLAAAVSLAAAAVSPAGATAPHTETPLLPSPAGRSRRSRRTASSSPGSRRTPKRLQHRARALRRSTACRSTCRSRRDAHNVTCRWTVGQSPVTLAIAGKTSNVLWTLRESSPLEFDYLVGAGAGSDRARAPFPGARPHEPRQRPLVRRRRRRRDDARVRRHLRRLQGRGGLPRRHRTRAR